jgi:hypothetical protein
LQLRSFSAGWHVTSSPAASAQPVGRQAKEALSSSALVENTTTSFDAGTP